MNEMLPANAVSTQEYNRETFLWLQERSKALFSLISYYKCAMMEVETKLNEEFSNSVQ